MVSPDDESFFANYCNDTEHALAIDVEYGPSTEYT